MKITFDTTIFWGTGLSFEEQYNKVAEIGYKYINPYNLDFPGQHKRPKATNADAEWHRKAIAAAGLEVASLTTGFHIAHPDEWMRKRAIEHWIRMFEIGEIMGVKVFNTELGGDITQPDVCEEKFMQSLDVLVPELEKRGMRMDVQAHPFDFYETNKETVDIISAYNTPALNYLYSIPHTFYYDGGKGDIANSLKYAGKTLKHIIVADTWDHNITFRYNMNPPKTFARNHTHIGNIGEGDINWDACWKTLREMGFGEADDTIATFNPLGHPELVERDGKHVYEILKRELGGE